MPDLVEPDPPERTVLLELDGVVNAADLSVQSFARHATEFLTPDLGRAVIAGMRGFLEDKPELLVSARALESGLSVLRGAEDGDQAVGLLAAAAGLSQAQIDRARSASRQDLAASAWALEAPDGLRDLLGACGNDCVVAVLAAAGDPSTGAVLDACEITERVDVLIDRPVAAAVQEVLAAMGSSAAADRVLVIGTRWAGELADAQAAGCATGLIDRFGRCRGRPTWRSTDLAGLLPPFLDWSTAGGTP